MVDPSNDIDMVAMGEDGMNDIPIERIEADDRIEKGVDILDYPSDDPIVDLGIVEIVTELDLVNADYKLVESNENVNDPDDLIVDNHIIIEMVTIVDIEVVRTTVEIASPDDN